ncbi:MAG: penicillin acylase family protein, partial [Spirochaetia bacterium]
LSPADRAFMEAYARGVNAATTREPQPAEFRILHYTPEPWKASDSLAILQMISFGFCKDWEQELVRLELIVHHLKSGSTIERALAIWPARRDLPPHLVGRKPAVDPFASLPPIAPELASWLQETYGARGNARLPRPEKSTRARQEAEADPLQRALQMSFLSNNWAVDGRWTGTGKSAFAMDPHMPTSLPPFPYIIGLTLDQPDGSGFSVIGAGFPGIPALPFGTNGAVAWGPTSNWADTTDLFVEKPVPGRDGYYETEKGDAPFTIRTETFRVRHGRNYGTETRRVRISRHGVIVNDFIDRLPPDFPLCALARTSSIGDSFESMQRLYRAGSVSAARAALDGLTAFVGNWVLADTHGSIGYAGPVMLPLRRHALGTVPVPGWTGTYEWDGFVPAEKLPGIIDPPQGFLATANNQVVQPESTGYPLNFEGDVPFRVQRIDEVLSRGNEGGSVVEQMRRLQTDGTDTSWVSVQPLVSRSLEPLAAGFDLLGAAARMLRAWDGRVDPGSPAPTLYQSLLTVLMNSLLSDEVPPQTLEFLQFYFNADPLLFGILEDPANPAWEDLAAVRPSGRTGTPVPRGLGAAGEKRSPEQMVAAAFRTVVADLQEAYGNDLDEWTWRRAAPVTLMHPLGSVFGFWSLNRGRIDPRGTATSIFMHKYNRSDPASFPVIYGPAVRLVVDFADEAHSFISLPGGESGRPGTRHYDDMLPLFEKGQGVDLSRDVKDPANAIEGMIDLVPAPAD